MSDDEKDYIAELEQALDIRGFGALALAESRQVLINQLVEEKKALREQVAELEAQLAAALATIERMVDDHATG